MITDKISNALLLLSKKQKLLFVLMVDTSCIFLSVILAFYLRLGVLPDFTSLNFFAGYATVKAFLWSVFFCFPIFIYSGFYKVVFRYFDANSAITCMKSIMFYGAIYFLFLILTQIKGIPRTIGIIQPMILFLLIAGSRYFGSRLAPEIKRGKIKTKRPPLNCLVYGAGVSGRQVTTMLASAKDLRIVGFLDEDKSLHERNIGRFPIYSPEKIKKVILDFNIKIVLIALPETSKLKKNAIIGSLSKHDLIVRDLPRYSDIAQGKFLLSHIFSPSDDEILRRKKVKPNQSLMTKDVTGKSILITGAGGSIGSELCRQIIQLNPESIMLLDHSEFALFKINAEIEEFKNSTKNAVNVKPVLASITDQHRIQQVFRSADIDTIYHAAAYKHVPIIEDNIFEGIKNNFFGTMNLIESSIAYDVEKFVLVSSDKAVRPSNIMGASKRLAEMGIQAYSSEECKTIFAMVRFGNVIDSSGSVLPIFREQINSGGPITVTHKDITRYFMTIPEASQLVIQAGALTNLTENYETSAPLYVLDMGKPVRIYDLAKRLIRLTKTTTSSSNGQKEDIEIKITGLRPGEKLHEELLIGGKVRNTKHPKIKVTNEEFLTFKELLQFKQKLENAIQENNEKLVVQLLKKTVNGFHRTSQM